jgi:hypothetical protein
MGKLLYMVMYEVYGGKLLVHIKGIIADEAETVPTGNTKKFNLAFTGGITKKLACFEPKAGTAMNFPVT